ncbi:uncharacterized protein [Aegilops tauschii subsp. strangulata]|uniref:uncharacterized protein n=1 Tax=Aegilops tauschii subsp. strangulata TaxID=200361 RepID=UPI003CC8CA34
MATWPASQPALPDVKHKKFAELNRTERAFQVGEQVLLKLQPYVQKSVASCPCLKLAFKFFGPFSVIARIGPAAYKLELPTDSKIHPVFHVSQLKPFTPNYSPVFSELPVTTDLSTKETIPVEILDRRMMKKGNAPVIQLQVAWDTVPPTITWEDYDVLRRRYPQASIWEDDATEEEERSQGGENVTTTVQGTTA